MGKTALVLGIAMVLCSAGSSNAADSFPPIVASGAIGNADQTTITLTFNDYVDSASARNLSNYMISGGLSIVGVSVGPFAGEVTLTNSAPREIGRNYTLTVRDVRDAFPPADLISPNPTVLTLTQDVRLLAFDSVWRYHNEGQDLGSDWRSPDYYDLTWPSGPGLLGFESNEATLNILSNQNLFVRTTLSRGNFGTNITDYFRTLVNIPFDTAGVTFNVRHVVDDGAVFYLNGVEAAADDYVEHGSHADDLLAAGFRRSATGR